MTQVLIIGIIALLVLSGCIDNQLVPAGKGLDCGSDSECFEEAMLKCKPAFGQINQDDTQIYFSLSKVGSKTCKISIRLQIDKLDEKEIYESLKPRFSNSFYIIKDSFLTSSSAFIANSFIEELSSADPFECTFSYPIESEDKIDWVSLCDPQDYFKSTMATVVLRLQEKINTQKKAEEDIALRLGDLDIVNYQKLDDFYWLFSEGVFYTNIFMPATAKANIIDVELDKIQLDYSVENLQSQSFAVVNSIALMDSEEEADTFFSESKKKFDKEVSYEKIADSVIGKNSAFVKLAPINGYEVYRLSYVYQNAFVVLEFIVNDYSKENLLEKIKKYSTSINARINENYNESIFNLNCTLENYTDEVCETKYRDEQYTENECNERELNYSSTVFEGATSWNITLGCYAEVSTTITNNENINGHWIAKINIYDNQNNIIKSEDITHGINAKASQKFSLIYDYECDEKPQIKFSGSITAPKDIFCQDVEKTRQVPYEVCEDKQKNKFVCS